MKIKSWSSQLRLCPWTAVNTGEPQRPSSKKQAKTKSSAPLALRTLRGASIPREVLLSTFLGVDAWQKRGIDTIWDQYANDLEHWVLANQPTLDIDSGVNTPFLAF